MAAKKHKYKSVRQVASDQRVKEAADLLQKGKFEEALRELRQAERELQPRITLAGRKIVQPPPLVAAREAIPALLARTFALRARTATDLKQRIADLAEAVKSAPDDARYRIALGACRYLAGDAAGALNEFQSAPDSENSLVRRARAFGLLANQRADELPDVPELKALRDAFSGVAVTTADPLLAGVASLLVNDKAQARQTLSELPALTHNPSRAEAARLATQFFYSGCLNAEAQQTAAAFGDWREALRLLATHHLTPAWRERFVSVCEQTAVQAEPSLAQEGWQLVLQIAPDNQRAQSQLTATLRQQAVQAWRAGDQPQAAAAWQQALALSPKDETLLKNLALACEKLNRKREALQHWRTLAQRWRSQLDLHRDDAAWKERLLKIESHVIDLMVEQAQNDQDDQAIANAFEAALKLDPDNHTLRQRAVDILTNLELPQPALKHLDILATKQSVTADIHARKAMAYDQMRRYADARKNFTQARALEPDNVYVRRAYVAFLGNEAARAEQNGNPKQAIAYCEEQLALAPQHDKALTQLARLYFQANRHADAQRMLDRFTETGENKAAKFAIAGGLYLQYGKKKEAEAYFKKALALDAGAPIQMTIGISYWSAQNTKEALKYFDRVAETGTLDLVMEIATHLIEVGNQQDAERFLKKAEALDPTDPTPHMARVAGLLQVGNPFVLLGGLKPKDLEAARASLAEAERLTEGRPEYADLRDHLGQMKMMLAQLGATSGRGGLLGSLLGGLGGLPPFLGGFEDEEDDFFGFRSSRRKKSKPKKKKK